MQKHQHLLTNITIIRPILIVLLVFYHAFAIYSGGWEPIEGFPNIEVYKWLDKLSYAFMLETFVFVSGYVFGYQVRMKGECKLEAKDLFWSKFKRLIIPSVVFSLIYIILFKDISQPIGIIVLNVMEGVGHMWFLPMLFWCFVILWVIERLYLKPRIVLPILVFSSICSFAPLPLRLNVTMYYMLFFYVGYILQRKEISINSYYNLRNAIIMGSVFSLLFPSLTLFRDNSDEIIRNWGELFGNQLLMSLLECILTIFAKLIYSTIGLVLFLIVIGLFEKRCSVPLPLWFIKMGSLCMGVYLFQQFILKALYDYTTLPLVLGPYWLPWFGVIVAMLGSLMLSYLLRLTKAGRFLIG